MCLDCSYTTPPRLDIDIILNSMTVMIDISLQEDTEDQNSALGGQLTEHQPDEQEIHA